MITYRPTEKATLDGDILHEPYLIKVHEFLFGNNSEPMEEVISWLINDYRKPSILDIYEVKDLISARFELSSLPYVYPIIGNIEVFKSTIENKRIVIRGFKVFDHNSPFPAFEIIETVYKEVEFGYCVSKHYKNKKVAHLYES